MRRLVRSRGGGVGWVAFDAGIERTGVGCHAFAIEADGVTTIANKVGATATCVWLAQHGGDESIGPGQHSVQCIAIVVAGAAGTQPPQGTATINIARTQTSAITWLQRLGFAIFGILEV